MRSPVLRNTTAMVSGIAKYESGMTDLRCAKLDKILKHRLTPAIEADREYPAQKTFWQAYAMSD
jgi:hypothetical protein